jgi:hypothetical protein
MPFPRPTEDELLAILDKLSMDDQCALVFGLCRSTPGLVKHSAMIKWAKKNCHEMAARSYP